MKGGAPLYDAHFAEVLAFHEPGLAPAREETGAHPIDVVGQPAERADVSVCASGAVIKR